MKLTLRLMVSLPVVALCAMLGGAASAHTITPLTLAQQHVQTASRTVRPADVPTTITTDNVDLYTCHDTSCSVVTQLSEGYAVLDHCQLPTGSDSNGGWWSEINTPDFGTGWISNSYLSGGPGAIAGVPICSAK